MSYKFIIPFSEISIDDVGIVGGKTASLGEMYRELHPKGIEIPNGFAITADAFRYVLESNNLDVQIYPLLNKLTENDVVSLTQVGSQVRHKVLDAKFPEDLQEEILRFFDEFSNGKPHQFSVAVRSSATAEDLPDASFAGQQETYLNVTRSQLLATCQKCMASLFTDRAISYRIHKKFPHQGVALSIAVQEMVRSDLASSGVMFSLDTETGFKDVVLINGAYGLGENVVQGAVVPDEFAVFKPTLLEGKAPIIKKTLGKKEMKMIFASGEGKLVQNVSVDTDMQRHYCLDQEEILKLARWACAIEDHYSQKRGKYTPMDIEWAKDGVTGRLYITQARPETIQSQKDFSQLETFKLEKKSDVLITGRSVGERIASGPVRVIRHISELQDFNDGDVLVTDRTDPDWEPFMKKASAIVSNRGGRTCHAAIVSRELGLPAIVGAHNATEILKTGESVTVSCAEGEIGKVYRGILPFKKEVVSIKEQKKLPVKIMMNVAKPDEALKHSFLPNDGVGLVRMEFIINGEINIHPMALIDYDALSDVALKRKIDEKTYGYSEKQNFFVDKLAEGLGMIAAAYYPKDVIIRASDFKTNEYANLLGGEIYEPKEENPMIGFRGASRYYHPSYQKAFALECEVIKKLRNDMGFTNVKFMIPFCRTVEEGKKVIKEMEKNGLKQGDNGFEVYVMCEIPSNVILADQFSEVFDGFSIGSNDLTQLVLGLDRDSDTVASLFDERNDAVKSMIASVIKTAKAKNKKIGICGQAPSDYPEFAEFLLEQGIDSISLNPDVVVKTRLALAKH